MLYNPKDQQKLVDMYIALDTAVSILFTVLNRHDETLATDVAESMQTIAAGVHKNFPEIQADNIKDKLAAWTSLLTTPPTPAGRH